MVTVICITLPSGPSLTRTFWSPFQIQDIWVDAYITFHTICSTVHFLCNAINNFLSTDLLLHICMESAGEHCFLNILGRTQQILLMLRWSTTCLKCKQLSELLKNYYQA